MEEKKEEKKEEEIPTPITDMARGILKKYFPEMTEKDFEEFREEWKSRYMGKRI
ncbi:MAG: hypothetical protein ACE5KT_04265 [Methanosarcinales archaeon]